jgi:hypothetical protein
MADRRCNCVVHGHCGIVAVEQRSVATAPVLGLIEAEAEKPAARGF